MGEELARHKEALEVAIGALRELGLDYAHFTETVEKRVAAVLEPAGEVEEMPAVRIGVYSEDGSEFLCSIVDEPDARKSAEKTWPRCQLVSLTGTIKRPIKIPVVREVKVYMTSVDWEDTVARCFMDHPDIHGEHGELIFRYTD